MICHAVRGGVVHGNHHGRSFSELIVEPVVQSLPISHTGPVAGAVSKRTRQHHNIFRCHAPAGFAPARPESAHQLDILRRAISQKPETRYQTCKPARPASLHTPFPQAFNFVLFRVEGKKRLSHPSGLPNLVSCDNVDIDLRSGQVRLDPDGLSVHPLLFRKVWSE